MYIVNGIFLQFLDLFDLLYFSAMHKIGISAGPIISAAHTLNNQS